MRNVSRINGELARNLDRAFSRGRRTAARVPNAVARNMARAPIFGKSSAHALPRLSMARFFAASALMMPSMPSALAAALN